MSTELSAYKLTINISVGELKHVLEWCDQSIGGRYRFMEDETSQFYDSWIFTFDHEEDMLVFVLSWT